ncbi:MAG TPA: replication initiation factor domain-containing protein [Leptospiraceae bacterium]|nr:replication initiation factor domain-containing protein [Leptospiraceae bacterium]HMW08107.1 replication initiation factor domain-containing protein [Leptospiraceae bacterium]HMY33818.1 replication initiation factor domain-containing protein [Leptospiraceae bacterium]HMZ65929.1 replication initiation factor domain-containing protein [Leptospiraceae bacterium]HNA08849.1 replication initiation factor domain-containing protein [Leptospiraceae bacterium]
MFKNCKWNRTKREGSRPAGITRIDFALDDFEGCIDLDLLEYKIKKGCYVTRLVSSMNTTGFNLRDRVESGKTIYLGDRGAETFFRYYDKKAKCKNDGIEIDPSIDVWNRMEIEMKLGRANWFTYNYLNNENFNPYEAILGMFRLTQKPLSKKQKNKHLFEVDRLYSKFLHNTKKATPLKVPQLVYDLQNLENYVEKTTSGASDTYIRIFGLKKYLEVLENRKFKTNETPKYSALLEKNSGSFEQEDYTAIYNPKIKTFKKVS